MSQRSTKLTAPRKQRTTPRQAGYFTSTGPKTVELALYQGGLATVRELRAVDLSAGFNALYLEGLPTQFQPNSQMVLEYAGPGELDLGASTYRAANLDKHRVLQSSVNSKCWVKVEGGLVEGILKASFGNEALVQLASSEHIVVVPTTAVELESIPQGLSATPSLMMSPSATVAGAYDLRVLYETNGLSWSARYSAFFDEKKGVLTRLQCDVAIVNGSGARFNGAVVKLLSGENYGAQPPAYALAQAESVSFGGGARKMAAPRGRSAVSQSVGESHLYEVPGAVTILDGDQQQVTLFLVKDVPVTREFFLPASNDYYNLGDGESRKLPVFLRLRAKNTKKNKLGTCALPAGEVGIWQKDTSGSEQKTGNSSTEHVSIGDGFKFEYGPSSDVKAERRLVEAIEDPEPEEAEATPSARPVRPLMTAGGPGMPGDDVRNAVRESLLSADQSEQDDSAEETEAPRYRTEEREIKVTNFKDEAVTVLVSETYPEKSEFLRQPDFGFAAQGATGGVIPVQVAAKGESVVSYRLRWRLN